MVAVVERYLKVPWKEQESYVIQETPFDVEDAPDGDLHADDAVVMWEVYL